MSLLKNAIDSIETGVEDYLHGSDRRKVSAIRNVYAGILLLFKEKLRLLSSTADYPEILIYSRIKPSLDETGKVIFAPKNKNSTVSADEIKSLFKELKIGYDKEIFNKLQTLRNQIEHYYSSESPKVIEESLSKSFLLIRNFIRKQLNEEPAKLLSESCWQTLIDLQNVYDAELNECLSSIKKIDFKYQELEDYVSELVCQNCGSELVKATNEKDTYPDIDLQCCNCGNEFNFVDALPELLNHVYYADNYEAATQGGEYSIEECPKCNSDTFQVFENFCYACDFQRKYYQCYQCGSDMGEILNRDDERPKICDGCECFNHMMEKD